VLLHGICYDFFFVTGYIYVDQRADKSIRSQAQSFLVLVTQGLGMLIGSQICGALFKSLSDDKINPTLTMPQWQTFWLIPCAMAAVVLVLFCLLFRNDAAKLTEAAAEDEMSRMPAQDVV
jgi:MFS family permease